MLLDFFKSPFIKKEPLKSFNIKCRNNIDFNQVNATFDRESQNNRSCEMFLESDNWLQRSRILKVLT